MRDSYDDSPAQAREAGLRRLGRLTWRSTQIGALATVGFAIVFARTAPAQTTGNQSAAPPKPAPAALTPARSPAHTATRHGVKPHKVTGSPGTSAAATGAGQAQSAPTSGTSASSPASAAPSSQPAPQPTAAPTTPRPSPTLAPPSSAPAPAPSTSSPAPTVTSTTHGGG